MAIRRSFFKDRRLAYFTGYRSKVQVISITGAASAAGISTLINPFGITFIESTGTGGPHRVMLPRPPAAGIVKTVIAQPASTADILVVNQSTADLFYGSTVNSVLFSTLAKVKGQRAVQFISRSTAVWALLDKRGTTSSTQYPFTLAKSSN